MKSKWPQVQSRLAEVEIWLRDGLTEAQVCKNLGVSHEAFARYKRRYVELVEAIKRGKAILVTELENALVKRAMGYDYDEVKTYIKVDAEGNEIRYTEKTRKHLPPDVGASAFLLKNKAPDRYTDNRAALDLKKQELQLREMLEKAKVW